MFITLEGSEGSGKTSQLPALANRLREAGYNTLSTREPGGTRIGDQVRAILFDHENNTMRPTTETLLFLAARAQLIEQVIRPHLNSGGVVVSDRYADSTLAYQGYGRGLDLDQLKVLLAFATCSLKPDLTILLDLDVEVGLRRRAGGKESNWMDELDLAFYQRVREGYLKLAQAEPQRWVIVDAGGTPEQVQTAIREVVLARLQAAPR